MAVRKFVWDFVADSIALSGEGIADIRMISVIRKEYYIFPKAMIKWSTMNNKIINTFLIIDKSTNTDWNITQRSSMNH